MLLVLYKHPSPRVTVLYEKSHTTAWFLFRGDLCSVTQTKQEPLPSYLCCMCRKKPNLHCTIVICHSTLFVRVSSVHQFAISLLPLPALYQWTLNFRITSNKICCGSFCPCITCQMPEKSWAGAAVLWLLHHQNKIRQPVFQEVTFSRGCAGFIPWGNASVRITATVVSLVLGLVLKNALKAFSSKWRWPIPFLHVYRLITWLGPLFFSSIFLLSNILSVWLCSTRDSKRTKHFREESSTAAYPWHISSLSINLLSL